MSLLTVVGTELLKLRRSRVPPLTLVAFALGPIGGGVFMWIAMEPARAAELGLIGTKSELVGLEASWPGYLTMITQMVGIVGGLLLAVIAAYVYGREYVEGTAKNMLALPLPRWWLVVAKLVVVALWWLALMVVILIEAAGVALVLGLPEYSGAVLAGGAGAVLLAAAVVFLLTPVVAWLATLGRGYLPPLGFAMLALVMGNVLGATGWGKWFPWSIAPLFAGVAGPRVEVLAPGSIVVLFVTFFLGLSATIAQVRWADSTG
jgi:ABC-type transport system involved in multi-copper enzyme maturation permease subunit